MKMKDLREYVELLIRLQNNGFNCNKELNEAITALHKEMFKNYVSKDKSKEEVNILVFEKDFDGMSKSCELFQKMFGGANQSIKTKDKYKFVFGNTTVEIYNLFFKVDANAFRGKTYDMFIDHADFAKNFPDYSKSVIHIR